MYQKFYFLQTQICAAGYPAEKPGIASFFLDYQKLPILIGDSPVIPSTIPFTNPIELDK